jgi:nucleoside-diphosphate kinase
MAIEHTFIMIKPDGVARRLVGEVVGRLEQRGLTLEKMRLLMIPEEMAERHYAEHVERPFFGELIAFITSGPVVAMEWSGTNAIALCRTLMGATNPVDAVPGSIRGDLATVVTENIVHGSDSPESAARELALFFTA